MSYSNFDSRIRRPNAGCECATGGYSAALTLTGDATALASGTSKEHGTQGVHLSLISEKSRSEFIVAPILLATRELSGNRVAIYSGQRLDVDES